MALLNIIKRYLSKKETGRKRYAKERERERETKKKDEKKKYNVKALWEVR